MPKIIAYAWDGGITCIDCTRDCVRCGALREPHDNRGKDENGIPNIVLGHNGVRVRPVFSTDEQPYAGLYCDTCCDEIVAPTPERFQT